MYDLQDSCIVLRQYGHLVEMHSERLCSNTLTSDELRIIRRHIGQIRRILLGRNRENLPRDNPKLSSYSPNQQTSTHTLFRATDNSENPNDTPIHKNAVHCAPRHPHELVIAADDYDYGMEWKEKPKTEKNQAPGMKFEKTVMDAPMKPSELPDSSDTYLTHPNPVQRSYPAPMSSQEKPRIVLEAIISCLGKRADRNDVRESRKSYSKAVGQPEKPGEGNINTSCFPHYPNTAETDQCGRKRTDNAPLAPLTSPHDIPSHSLHPNAVQRACSTPYPSKKIGFADFIQRVLKKSDRDGGPESNRCDTNGLRRERCSAQVEKARETTENPYPASFETFDRMKASEERNMDFHSFEGPQDHYSMALSDAGQIVRGVGVREWSEKSADASFLPASQIAGHVTRTRSENSRCGTVAPFTRIPNSNYTDFEGDSINGNSYEYGEVTKEYSRHQYSVSLCANYTGNPQTAPDNDYFDSDFDDYDPEEISIDNQGPGMEDDSIISDVSGQDVHQCYDYDAQEGDEEDYYPRASSPVLPNDLEDYDSYLEQQYYDEENYMASDECGMEQEIYFDDEEYWDDDD
jgi:hypothetical protein